ncbi:MAG TPA: FAD-binding oxidoreductase [Gaiellales bacterium]|jgi:glycolate oxidase subunit GlcD|nr:FAD-binding oxidoreductase [Gaiellales bacterium]
MHPGELAADLARVAGPDAVLEPPPAVYETDSTGPMGLRGEPAAVVLPANAEAVRAVVAWCYERGVAIVPRGGGTGFAGGAVPVTGGVVVDLSRMTAVRSFDPLLWRAQVEAGMPTAALHRLARESGLWFPPDPGAAEQSQIGGNIATNAGGPHAFRYGTTGAWVTGLEAVIPPGELITVGGAVRKDVAGYDLKRLLIGSEGTLGIITAAWLRLIPAPELAVPVVATYGSAEAGCAAIEAVLGNGLQAAAIEYADGGALAIAGRALGELADGAGFLVLAEADGDAAAARELAGRLAEVLGENARTVRVLEAGEESAAVWRWREGVSSTVTAARGGRLAEDIAVPLDRLAEAVLGTVEIGHRHGLDACSWGHAGDGNLHSSFLFDPGAAGLDAARAAAEELFALAAALGGTISGEHGLGLLKAGRLGLQWTPPALALHQRIKHAFDPRNLMNPGKKV